MRDQDGRGVRAGDVIHWSYGIPMVPVVSDVIEDGGELVAIHRRECGPPRARLSDLLRWGYSFSREDRR